MKVKVYPGPGQTQQEAEEHLEKAILTKREKQEERYAQESYQNNHLDLFHEHIMAEHKRVIDDIVTEVRDLLSQTLCR